jgi:hypothetical protein
MVRKITQQNQVGRREQRMRSAASRQLAARDRIQPDLSRSLRAD